MHLPTVSKLDPSVAYSSRQLFIIITTYSYYVCLLNWSNYVHTIETYIAIKCSLQIYLAVHAKLIGVSVMIYPIHVF